MKSISDPIGR